MIATSHLFLGAAIGTLVPDPLIAFGLGLMSHFLLDAIPHFEPGLVLRKRSADGKIAEEMGRVEYRLAWLDMIIGTVMTLLVWRTSGSQLSVLTGALGAILPDLVDNVPWWKIYTGKTKLLGWIRPIHRGLHFPTLQGKYIWWGLLPPIVIFALSLGWVLR